MRGRLGTGYSALGPPWAGCGAQETGASGEGPLQSTRPDSSGFLPLAPFRHPPGLLLSQQHAVQRHLVLLHKLGQLDHSPVQVPALLQEV